MLLIVVIAAIAMVDGYRFFPSETEKPNKFNIAQAADLPTDPESLSASDPVALRALSPSDAEAANDAIPISQTANPAASALIVPIGDGQNWLRSLDCMTAAIYYEAGNEPVDGQRAVAQVVLNRLRHPVYPHSVCGVVLQGSERKTGCQFTFTCDGSLARVPAKASWLRARAVAAAALSGYVYAPVGWATHYHTKWVAPYWAPTLVKNEVIGAHIFYRWPGRWGEPVTFTARYASQESGMSTMAALATMNENPEAMMTGAVAATPTSMAERPILAINGAAPAPKAGAMPTQPVANVPAPRRWVLGASDEAAKPDTRNRLAAATPAPRENGTPAIRPLVDLAPAPIKK